MTVATDSDPYFALPKLYGAPAYARPPRVVPETERPFDPDDLPIVAEMTDEERTFTATVFGPTDYRLTAVPDLYRDGSLALGATRWQTVRRVVLPAASSGIITAIILGMGRAIGETMAVIMVAGNALQIPTSLLDPVRTLTSNIALELSYAAARHREALFATGIVLFVIIMILNLSATLITRRR